MVRGISVTHSPFNRAKVAIRPSQLQTASLADFSGGLNTTDSELVLKTKYAVVLDNVLRATDGSRALRWGTKLWTTTDAVVAGTIIDIVYFANHLIVFMSSGEIAAVDDSGAAFPIWNAAIAAALPGAPSGWGSTYTSVDTTTFKGSLIVTNGVDKPLLIQGDISVNYLQDLASGSNINTPIGKYCTTVANYAVIAGIPSSPGEVYVSAVGASGVWPGDTAPNDSISFDASTYAPAAGAEIIGINNFRNNLLASFDGAVVIFTLGTYDSAGVHQPKISDTIIEHGIINHRCVVTLKNDFIFADTKGTFTASRNAFAIIDTQPLAQDVLSTYQASIPFEGPDRGACFAVYNSLEHRDFIFAKSPTGSVTWCMSTIDKISNPTWSKIKGWEWSAGCVSSKGRVFFAVGKKIFQYGNAIFSGEDYTADFIGDNDGPWITGTAYLVGDKRLQGGVSYICLQNHVSNVFADDLSNKLWEVYVGDPIVFDWELPWTDAAIPIKKKRLVYLTAATSGKANFSIDLYADNFYKKADGSYDPAVTLDFVAGDGGGYGNQDQLYGGGRRLRDERMFGLPVDFRILKMRVHGSTTEKLSITTIGLMFNVGTLKRA